MLNFIANILGGDPIRVQAKDLFDAAGIAFGYFHGLNPEYHKFSITEQRSAFSLPEGVPSMYVVSARHIAWSDNSELCYEPFFMVDEQSQIIPDNGMFETTDITHVVTRDGSYEFTYNK